MRGARARRCSGNRCTQRSRGSTTCESALLTSVVTMSLPQDHRARGRRAGAGDDERDLGPRDLVGRRAAKLPDGLEHVGHAMQLHLAAVAAVGVDRQGALAANAAVGDEPAALALLAATQVLEA